MIGVSHRKAVVELSMLVRMLSSALTCFVMLIFSLEFLKADVSSSPLRQEFSSPTTLNIFDSY